MRTEQTSQKITPFLWFDGKAEEAMNFYTSVFPGSAITRLSKWEAGDPFPAGQVKMGSFHLSGVQFHAFDAGPQFRFNPSISFFVTCETAAEAETLWNKLIRGGEALMPLDKYPWSERYGWLTDRFGVSWQLSAGTGNESVRRISPLLLFSGPQRGRAGEAIQVYTSVFSNSGVEVISRYKPGERGPEGMINYAQYTLAGQTFMAMDSGVDNDFPFNEAISLFVTCQDQAEVDYFWSRLTEDGQEGPCGWLKDAFGVSWQIVPEALIRMISSGKTDNIRNMMNALMQMKKPEVASLEAAFNNTAYATQAQ